MEFYHLNHGQIHQRGMNKIILYVLISIFLLTQIFDVYSSYILFGDLDPVVFKSIEFNPAVAWLMEKIGLLPGLLVAKAAAVSFLAWVLYKMGPSMSFLVVLSLINLGYIVGLYYHNYRLLIEFKL